jgi:hypothetical protein
VNSIEYHLAESCWSEVSDVDVGIQNRQSTTCDGFVRQKRGKKVPSFIKQKVASSSPFFVKRTLHWKTNFCLRRMIDEPIKESNEDKNTEDTEDAGKIKKLG